MLIILHGEDIVVSRNRLVELFSEAKLNGREIIQFEGRKLSLTELKQAIEAQSLFDQERLVVIEGLFGRQQSKDKEALINYLRSVGRDARSRVFTEVEKSQTVLVWEDKALTAAQLKGFEKATIQEFKLPPALWEFLDGFGPGKVTHPSSTESRAPLIEGNFKNLELLEKVLKHQPVEMVFGLLVRRLRYLIVAREAGVQGLSGFKELQLWQQRKILSQARQFSFEQLRDFQEALLEADYARKTGGTSLTLEEQLKMLLLF